MKLIELKEANVLYTALVRLKKIHFVVGMNVTSLLEQRTDVIRSYIEMQEDKEHWEDNWKTHECFELNRKIMQMRVGSTTTADTTR